MVSSARYDRGNKVECAVLLNLFALDHEVNFIDFELSHSKIYFPHSIQKVPFAELVSLPRQ